MKYKTEIVIEAIRLKEAGREFPAVSYSRRQEAR